MYFTSFCMAHYVTNSVFLHAGKAKWLFLQNTKLRNPYFLLTLNVLKTGIAGFGFFFLEAVN